MIVCLTCFHFGSPWNRVDGLVRLLVWKVDASRNEEGSAAHVVVLNFDEDRQQAEVT